MATGFTPTYLKDPIDWSVDDVMTFLWPRVPHKWAHSYQPPDIDVLGPIFRARGVNGRVLLHSVTTDLLRVSMGITNMSERIYILHIIRYLRDHSVAFAHPAASGQSLPTGPATPTAGTPLQSTSSKQPKRATNLMTTPLMPNHAGLATDPAFWTPLSRVPATATVSAPPMVFEPNPPVDAFTAELLRRHPPETNDDNALPLYGDSESSDYDANEQREIEDLPEKEPPQLVLRTHPGPVDLAGFNEIVDNFISEERQEWIGSITRELGDSNRLLTKGRDRNAVRDRIMGSLRKLERRLDNLRDAIYGHRYTSAPSICKSCECLLETLKDKFFCEWQLAMLDRPNVLSGDSDTFAISARPASDDLLDLSSSSDDNEDGESENGTEDEGEPCDSEDSHEAEPAKKKPRLEYHIPEGRVIIDLTRGDTPPRVSESKQPVTSIEAAESPPKAAKKTSQQMLQKLQKKGVTPERYRLNKAARKAKADVEAERPRILERLRIHSTMGVSMLLQPKSDPTLDPYPVILHPLARSAPSVKGSDSEVPAFPWYYDPPLARLNAPASPAFLPQVVPPDPRLSPPVHPRSVSPMSDEGLAMYQ